MVRTISDIDVPEMKENKVLFGGKLVEDLLATEKYVLINSSDKVIIGPYTRYDPSAPDKDSKKSVLDLFIISKELNKYVEFLFIDKNMNYTPCNPSTKRVIYTDHYGLLLSFKGILLACSVIAHNEYESYG